MIIKILGTGCPKCKRLEQLAKEVLTEMNMTAEVEKVTSMDDIMAYDIISTPALVINEAVLSSGRIPNKKEIYEWISTLSIK
ncbi:MAG: TM0996/MTH895 family glutaredoxin-like protein [Anaerolineaceae bacterium]|nr:TM0996/MTH895 family glutaredoxin-like protein [Anaerolineaceae bacterium]